MPIPNFPPCGSAACVDIEDTGTDFRFVSTLGADKGAVVYNADEVAQFFADVKAGKWDDFQELAEARRTQLAAA